MNSLFSNGYHYDSHFGRTVDPKGVRFIDSLFPKGYPCDFHFRHSVDPKGVLFCKNRPWSPDCIAHDETKLPDTLGDSESSL